MLTNEIKHIFYDEKCRIGSPRVTQHLRHEGIVVGRNRVARLMKEAGLQAKGSRKYKATTNSNHNLRVYPNLLEQDFSANRANEK